MYNTERQKNGKGWATFIVEGYDESYEFRIFDEEYLKLRHFLVINQFIYIRVSIKEGWVNRTTGKKSDPKIQFLNMMLLQDVLTSFSKKLNIMLSIFDFNEDKVMELNEVFRIHPGNTQVSFEVLEIEKIKKVVQTQLAIDDVLNEETFDTEEDQNQILAEEVEEYKIVTKLSMESRKLKIDINPVFLAQLEQLNIKFKVS